MSAPFIGLISDTHGKARAAALDALRGAVWILHAGDIGSPDVLDALGQIAPVHAVRGNNDSGPWAEPLPLSMTLSWQGTRLHLVHDLHDLVLDPVRSGISVVVSGHSHKPSVEQRDGVLFVNPGSAGPRRFSLPVAVARIEMVAGAEAKILLLSGQ